MPNRSLQKKIPALLLLTALLLGRPFAAGAETANSQQIADRYEQMLVRAPEPGTAFDMVIDWYAGSGGGLEVLKTRWAKAAPESSAYLLLQGLLAEHLRTPDRARDFYEQALKASDDPVPAARLLATLETTEGNFPAAAAAYRTALASESLAPLDRMELMRSLALLYQRSFEDEKADAVWQEALKRFPDDPYVLEEAGEAFLAAGNYPDARSAFLRLQEVSQKDPYRKMAATLRLARTAELDGETDEAIKIYERALEETSAGSWIQREIRARIEEMFRRRDDLPGLLAYYERRTAAVPQDFQSLAAQATVLEDLGRSEEALDKLRAATALAPEHWKLQLRLLQFLARQGQQEEALAAARELAKPSDAPPEVLLAFGDLLWSKDTPESRAEALTTWQRLAPPDSTDPARIAMLAELLASKDKSAAAIAEWKRLLALNPAAVDVRQKLAQLYLEKNDETAAREIVSGLVAGDLATAENYLALARLQSRLEWTDAARATAATALAKFPEDPELLNFAWRQALEAKDTKLATELFPKVWQTAANDFFAEDAVKRYVLFVESNDLKPSVPEDSATELDATLRFHLAVSRNDEEAAAAALAQLRPLTRPVRAARAAVVFAGTFGSAGDQIAALRAVAETEPRMATESLKSVARLEADSGQTDAALQTVAALIEHTPADGSLYMLAADLAAGAGKIEAASRRLREGIRYAAEPGPLRLQLAEFLFSQGRTRDAQETLQEALEAESNESRRLEIFRRQVELAMQTGTLEPLIASLREKQAKEEGGARYGTYLAEIFILQGDFLSAREELAKSLGHNPDNPRAVAKLMNLADRGGDQEEGIRLANRLVELEPSPANRSDLITRLLNSPDPDRGLAELEKVRPEIIKNPDDWSETLLTLRRVGYATEADELIAEMAAGASSDVEELLAIANLYLSQLNLDASQKILWQIVRSGDFPDAMEAIITQPLPARYFAGQARFSFRLQTLNPIYAQVRNSLQLVFRSPQGRHTHFGGGMFFRGQPGAGSSRVTPEQKAVVRAYLTLQELARAQNEEAEFARKSAGLKEKLSVPAQFLLLTMQNDTSGLKKLMTRQAGLENADLETDRLFLSSPLAQLPEAEADREKIAARVAAADPEAAFQLEVTELMKPVEGQSAEETKASRPAQIRLLMKNPVAAKNPNRLFQLAYLSLQSEDLDLAEEILQSIKKTEKETPSPAFKRIDQQIANLEMRVLRQQILNGDPKARATFDRLIVNADSGILSRHPMMGGPRIHHGFGSSAPNRLLQNTSDLVIGDSVFPWPLFRTLAQSPGADLDKVRDWFDQQAASDQLDASTLGLVYADWMAGKKEDAIQKVETLHAADPTPRSAALLLEMYERSKTPAKALEVMELAELQVSETPDVRTFRKIRALRANGKLTEAKDLAKKLARSRVSYQLRNLLRNELGQLGVSTKNYLSLANVRRSRSHSHSQRFQQFQQQFNKLKAEKKNEEAEKLARRILAGPLPQMNDHQTINLRQTVINSLRNFKRLGALEADLTARLTADPGDFNSAIRLMEIDRTKGGGEKTDRISPILAADPDRIPNLGYAVWMLQNQPNSPALSSFLNTVIQTDPDLLYKSGIRLQELSQRFSQGQMDPELAETIAHLDEDAFNRLFLPSRISNPYAEMTILSQLAEMCTLKRAAGTADPSGLKTAIALLQRAKPNALANLQTGLLPLLRLAELQLQIGDKAGATATLTDLFSDTQSRPHFGMFGGGGQNLSNVLSGLFMNRMPGQNKEDQITRLTKLTTETGTTEALLAVLDKGFAVPQAEISAALLFRTSLGLDGTAEEWRKVALEKSPLMGYFGPQMLPTVLGVLAAQKDAAKLIPAFLKRVSSPQRNMGGDMSLVAINENLPLLQKYAKDPAVKQYIDSLLSQSLSNPNAAQHFMHSQAYPEALSTLLEFGYEEEARKLFDLTQSTRSAARSFGNEAALALIAAQLDAAEGRETRFDILCALQAQPDGTPRVHWTATPVLPDTRNGQRVGPSWSTTPFPISREHRPVSLSFFAGPNPAQLSQVATTKNPSTSGSRPVKLPDGLGLLQARWKLPDGKQMAGPLSPYVLGRKNLLVRPAASSSLPLQTGQPGPFGDQSATTFDRLLSSSSIKLPLGEFALPEPPALIALTGWLRTESNNQSPQVTIAIHRKDATDSNENVYFPSTGSGQWRQFVRIWTRGCRIPGVNSTPKDARSFSVQIQIRANRGYNYQWQVKGTWAGIAAYRLPAQNTQDEWQTHLNEVGKLTRAKDHVGACREMVAAFRLSPRNTSDQSHFLKVFEKADQLPQLYKLLADPALYRPNPLDRDLPSINNDSLLGALVKKALAPDAPPAAADWMKVVQSARLNDGLEFQLDAASFLAKVGLGDAAPPAEEVLEVLGFQKDTVDEERVKNLLGRSDVPTWELLALLDTPEQVAAARKILAEAPLPAPLQAAPRTLEAWLLAPGDPEKALQLWQAALGIRYSGRSSLSFASNTDREMFLRIGTSHPASGDLIAAIRAAGAASRQNPGSQQRTLTGILSVLAQSDSPQKEDYARAWADAEIEGLGMANFHASSGRVLKLAEDLKEREDWNRLTLLLTAAEKHRNLKHKSVQEKLANFRAALPATEETSDQ